jgi:hypothetical protein
MKTIFIFLLISQSAFAQYSSALQHSSDYDVSNGYESGYVNNYDEKVNQQDQEAADNLMSGTGNEGVSNAYKIQKEEVREIDPGYIPESKTNK